MIDLRERVHGIFVKLPSTQIIDLARTAGFDFVIVDLEHSQLSEAQARTLVTHADVTGLPAIVRVPEIDRGQLNRLLEAGVSGVQLSTVTTVAQVDALAQALRYAPAGDRSVGTAHHRADYGRMSLRSYIEARAARPVLSIIQLETAITEDPLEAIVSAGADVVFVGKVDLTVALEFDSDRIAERVDEIRTAARSAGVALGGVDLSDGEGTYDAVGTDLGLLGAELFRLGAAAGHRDGV